MSKPKHDCPHNAEPIRSERWDAYYCGPCNIWLEGKCDGPIAGEVYDGCYFSCWDRPETPSAEAE